MPYKNTEDQRSWHAEYQRKKAQYPGYLSKEQKRRKKFSKVCRMCDVQFMGRLEQVFCGRLCALDWRRTEFDRKKQEKSYPPCQDT